MARGPLAFKQSDVVRAIKGVQAAGLEIARIEIMSGMQFCACRLSVPPANSASDCISSSQGQRHQQANRRHYRRESMSRTV